MRFPRVVRLDSSDLQVFETAAAPGEWAVPGSFAFLEIEPERLKGKEKLAFASGWLGLESFGRASLVEVAEIDEAGFASVIERLARHFVEHYGAPSLVEALPAARAEAEDAAALCDHKLHTLLAIEREPAAEASAPGGVVERVRVVRPGRAVDHAKIWEIEPDEEA
jgi:hypothetical protein